MSKVTTYNGQDGTSPEGLFFHQFSGRTIDQYDWPNSDGDPRQNIGDVFVLTISAEVDKVVEDEIKDGRRQTIGFKVIDSKLGNIVAKVDTDPAQTSIEDLGEDPPTGGDYGDYETPDEEGDDEGEAGEFGPEFSGT